MGNYYGLIIGMAVVTYFPRFLPMLLLSKKEISPSFSKWMSYIPVSIFASLVASDVFFWENDFNLYPAVNLKLIPTLLVLVVAMKTRSILWSMLTGIVSMTVLWYVL